MAVVSCCTASLWLTAADFACITGTGRKEAMVGKVNVLLQKRKISSEWLAKRL